MSPFNSPHFQLQEWQKVVFSTLLGFAAGIVAEPLKAWVSNAYRKRKIRRLCYDQIYSARHIMTTVLNALEKNILYGDMTSEEYARMMVPGLDVGALRYVIDKEAAIIYQLEMATLASQIVRLIEEVTTESTIEEVKRVARAVIWVIDSSVDHGKIDGNQLSYAALRHTWKERKQYSGYPWNREPESFRFAYKNASMWDSPYRYRPALALMILRIRRLRQIRRSLSEPPKPNTG